MARLRLAILNAHTDLPLFRELCSFLLLKNYKYILKSLLTCARQKQLYSYQGLNRIKLHKLYELSVFLSSELLALYFAVRS